MQFNIKQGYEDIESVKILFNEYTLSLGVDLAFQNYDEELSTLPGKYSTPRGRLYLLNCDGATAGCVALRPINNVSCEMKRLYVRPKFRGMGFGKILAKKTIEDAREIKYKKMYLDTLLSLDTAIKMYKKMGFKETEAYYNNPCPDVVYFCLEL